MKPLRPIVILTFGPTILGATFVAAATILLPEPATLRGVLSVFLVGVLFGLFVLLPFVAGEHTRSGFIYRHLYGLDRWSAMLLALGLGHLLLRNLGDSGIPVAVFLVILAAAFRVFLAGQVKQATGKP